MTSHNYGSRGGSFGGVANSVAGGEADSFGNPSTLRSPLSHGHGSNTGTGAGAASHAHAPVPSHSTSTGSPVSAAAAATGADGDVLPPSATAGPQAGGDRLYDVPAYMGSRHVFQAQIRELARGDVTPMSLSHIVSMGSRVTLDGLLQNAAFLCAELPVRLSKRISELEALPYGLSNTVPVMTVRQWYEDSLREIVSFPPPQDVAEAEAFRARLENIFERHRDVVPMLARGVLQIKEAVRATAGDQGCPFLTQFLDRFYLSRIGIRVLIAQHLALHSPIAGYSGIIALEMDPVEVVKIAIEDAGRLCEFTCGDAPAVNVTVGNAWELEQLELADKRAADANKPASDRESSTSEGETLVLTGSAPVSRHRRLAYVPSHLHHIMFELLKNSMRATVEAHRGGGELPDVEVMIVFGEKDLGVKVSDQGGGIARGDMDKIWTYLHTTAGAEVQKNLLEQSTSGRGLTSAPLAGFGYGLPLSRLFARYFGGDLQLCSIDGYGTDAFLWLHKLSDNQESGSV